MKKISQLALSVALATGLATASFANNTSTSQLVDQYVKMTHFENMLTILHKEHPNFNVQDEMTMFKKQISTRLTEQDLKKLISEANTPISYAQRQAQDRMLQPGFTKLAKKDVTDKAFSAERLRLISIYMQLAEVPVVHDYKNEVYRYATAFKGVPNKTIIEMDQKLVNPEDYRIQRKVSKAADIVISDVTAKVLRGFEKQQQS